MTADPLFGKYLRTALFEEVFPTVKLPDAEKRAFAESIVDRFLNPSPTTSSFRSPSTRFRSGRSA
jgi:mannitol-1-phosphate/altronate dehydrogenase